MILSGERRARPFEFERDTFAFANELIWQYRFDSQTGATTTFRTNPPPTYSHRCFVLVRSARQFLYHARFAPDQPEVTPDAFARLIRKIVSQSPRREAASEQRIVLPGFASLRSFSKAHEKLLKVNCGGAWQSYVLRSHWRMVFPISREHQARTAEQLSIAISQAEAPIIHLFRFPQLTINHGIILFAITKQLKEWRFTGYDPNLPDHPVELSYDLASRRFLLPRNHYWAGGQVDVVQIYRGWLY
jgi:hypothetical protein